MPPGWTRRADGSWSPPAGFEPVQASLEDVYFSTLHTAKAGERAEAADCDLAVFPELVLTGYPPMDLLDRPSFLDDTEAAIRTLDAALAGRDLDRVEGCSRSTEDTP